ncbi:hypothetical protein HU200_065296 [Digitaria exilis]|uniref:BTB domain-containing protein n=1 Tax=Digitaria exilis TaxID=1010633 RepID=A0A835A246_9POAL|nr:hypothetical protein HU200_065296 [Digitaria exilis]
MKHTFTKVREVLTCTLELEIDGFSVTKENINDGTAADSFESRCNLDGNDLEIWFHPALYVHGDGYYCLALELVFLNESRTDVMAVLGAKVTMQSTYEFNDFVPLEENKTLPRAFHRRFDRSLPIYIGVGRARSGVSYSERCSLTVECTITMFSEPVQEEGAIPVPSSNLTQHLGELLRSQAAADVTFSVKEIEDMDIAVFNAIVRFIYTDEVPELDGKPEAAAAMAFAENLLDAAGRYGLNRLKVACERRLALGMDVSTIASTLAVAEQQNSSLLKAKCVEFIAGGSTENLDAVLATEGYKHLVASRPMVLTELLKAAHGKNSICSSCKLRHAVSFEDQQFISSQTASIGTMKHTYTQLTEGVQSVHLLKIDGFSITKATIGNSTNCIRSRCNVDGYNFEIRFYPVYRHYQDSYILAVELAFLGKACTQGVEASLSGHLVEYESSGVAPKYLITHRIAVLQSSLEEEQQEIHNNQLR